jgi:hypothetical protein
MDMNPAMQWVFTVLHLAVAAAVTGWILLRWDRDRARLGLLVLLGGGLSVLAEPFLDRQGLIWHAAVGQWTLVRMFGHSVPLWMLPVYYWFIGGQTLFVVRAVRSGWTANRLFRLYLGICAMDAVLEMPILYAGGVYTYFGHQPFWNATWFPLPAWYMVLNGVLPIAAAAAVLGLRALGGRRYELLVPLGIPTAIFAVYPASAWPVWAALATGAPTAVTYLAGTATILLGVGVCRVLIQACRFFAAAGPGPDSPAHPVPSAGCAPTC